MLILNPMTLEQIYPDIKIVGSATGTAQKAQEVIDSIMAQMRQVTDATDKIGDIPEGLLCARQHPVDRRVRARSWTSFDAWSERRTSARMEGSPAAGQPYFQFTPEQLVAADPDVVLLPVSTLQERGGVHLRSPLRRAHGL